MPSILNNNSSTLTWEARTPGRHIICKAQNDDCDDEFTTLLFRIGGQDTLEAILDVFYELVYKDPELRPFFYDVSKQRLKTHQSQFLSTAFSRKGSGTTLDVGKEVLLLRHQYLLKRMGLCARHFDRMLVHLTTALKSIWEEHDVIDQVLDRLNQYRSSFQSDADKKEAQSQEMVQSNEEAQTSLLVRMGGEDTLEACIEAFYDLVMADQDLRPFFKGITLKHLLIHQQHFMRMAFTEIPKDFDLVGYIYKSHERLFHQGLTECHFDRVAVHLETALKKVWVEPGVIDSIKALIGSLRGIFQAKRG